MHERPAGSWPVELVHRDVVLRPLRHRDAATWNAVRGANAAWLGPWEATAPDEDGRPPTFRGMVRSFRREARAGRMLPFIIEVNGRLVGQVTVSGIVWGSLRSGHIGYWVDRSFAGRGIVPTAVAMTVDHCFTTLGLHRIEVNIRPSNAASLRVVEKLGFREEGVRARFLHIDGSWRDHVTYALTTEDVRGGVLASYLARRDALRPAGVPDRPRHTSDGA